MRAHGSAGPRFAVPSRGRGGALRARTHGRAALPPREPGDHPCRLSTGRSIELPAQIEEEQAPAAAALWSVDIDELRADLRGWATQKAWDDRGLGAAIAWELGFGLPLEGRHHPKSVPDAVDRARQHAAARRHRSGGATLSGALRVVDFKTGRLPKRDPAVDRPRRGPAARAVRSRRRANHSASRGYGAAPLRDPSGQLPGRRHRASTSAPSQRLAGVLAAIEESCAMDSCRPCRREDACKHCDYQPVCGPYEEERVRMKSRTDLTSSRRPEVPVTPPVCEARPQLADLSYFIEASAGTGKTTTLVDRIVEVLRSGVPVERIAAVTFTNAAAGEMKIRVRQCLEDARKEAVGEAQSATRCSGRAGTARACLHRDHPCVLRAAAAEAAGRGGHRSAFSELAEPRTLFRSVFRPWVLDASSADATGIAAHFARVTEWERSGPHRESRDARRGSLSNGAISPPRGGASSSTAMPPSRSCCDRPRHSAACAIAAPNPGATHCGADCSRAGRRRPGRASARDRGPCITTLSKPKFSSCRAPDRYPRDGYGSYAPGLTREAVVQARQELSAGD